MTDQASGDSVALDAEGVRRALLEAALQAHEDAGLSGLCAEGRWEAAVSALRSYDLSPRSATRAVEAARPQQATLAEFAASVAAPVPAPGAGSVAAVAGMLAAALAEMVARLTAGRKRYGDVDADMRASAGRAAELGAALATLAERDAVATADVAAAFRLRKGSGAFDGSSAESIERALVRATEVPLEIARAAAEVAELGAFVAERGKAVAVSEAGVAALLADAACKGVGFAVSANVASLRRANASGSWSTFADEAAALVERSSHAARRATSAVEAACSS